MYISKFREVSLEKKDKKNNFISEANKMINQNSTATIDNLDEAYIASLMDQLVWAPFPTDSESESERNNFCRFFSKICDILTDKCSQDDEDSLVVYESIPKYARYHLDEATNEPGYFKPINFLDIVRKNWSVLESETSTYEALISLVKLMSDYITGSELYLIFFEHLLEEKIATHHNATTFSDEEIKDIFC